MSPDLNPTDYLWDELECGLQARSSILGSILDLTNALLPQTHSKILWKAFPEEWRLLMPQEGQHISGLGFGIGYPTSLYGVMVRFSQT